MKASVTVQVKATKQYFPVMFFIILFNALLTFESVDKILKCGHLNENDGLLGQYSSKQAN